MSLKEAAFVPLVILLLASFVGNLYLVGIVDADHRGCDEFDQPALTSLQPNLVAGVWPDLPTTPEKRHQRLLADQASSASNSDNSASSASHGNTASHESSASSASSGSSETCKEFEGEHAHQHTALLFLFNIILLGTALLHLNALVPKLQFTIMLFILGMIVSALLEGADLKCKTGILGQSYIMWMDIDPHLLLYTMLPALLAGDAMTIDTSVAKRVSLQCLYLAGPGVLVSAFAVAFFLYFYFGWSFMLCLATASILCATDPVAVVALLKELGASPVLTVQIQGESLLNDGTAIVLYTIAYDIVSGEEYDSARVLMFLVKVVLLACAVGSLSGYVFFSWLRLANDRFKHACEVIQVLLTLSAAYWSFIMAEGVLEMSGVLATVCSSLVLAHHMWPHITNKDSLSNFWHTLEELMNIIIFLLAGSLCGQVMVHIELIDYLHLLVIYAVLTIFRGVLIFASRPLLRILSYDNMAVTRADAAVMTWGGLRGAVGLALAIQVRNGRGEDADGILQIDDDTSKRILFFVSGIAFLTTTINATTCPLLVDALGITHLPRAQELLLKKFAHQLVAHSESSLHPPKVARTLHDMLHHVEEEIHDKSSSGSVEETKNVVRDDGNGIVHRMSMPLKRSQSLCVDQDVICKAYDAVRQVFEQIPDKWKARLDHPGWTSKDLVADTEQMMRVLSSSGDADHEMCKVVNRTFLSMVHNSYYRQVEAGELRPGSPELDLLLGSVRFCQSTPTNDLIDFDFIYHALEDADVIEGRKASAEEVALPEHVRTIYAEQGKSDFLPILEKSELEQDHWTEQGETFTQAAAIMVMNHEKSLRRVSQSSMGKTSKGIDRIVRSATFNRFLIAAIILNGVCVVTDELARNDDNQDHVAWLIVELVFSFIFTVEAVLKIGHNPGAYFKDSWNQFDFFLVIVGIAGGIMSTIEYINSISDHKNSSALSSASKASRIIRIAKILRSMRLLKIFTLVHAMLSSHRHVSPKLAAIMLKVQTLNSFVQAHIASQKQMKRFFVGDFKRVPDVEIARCIMQSLVFVHKALHSICRVQRDVDTGLIDELLTHKETKRITEELEAFVQEAEEFGAVSPQEAHAILHPMHHTIAECLKQITTIDDGIVIHQDSPKAMAKPTEESIHDADMKNAIATEAQIAPNTDAYDMAQESAMERQSSPDSETNVIRTSATTEEILLPVPPITIEVCDDPQQQALLLVEDPDTRSVSRADQMDTGGVGSDCTFCTGVKIRKPNLCRM